MTGRLWQSSLRAGLLDPVVVATLAAAALIVLAGGLSLGGAAPPRGTLGTWLLDSDMLTYGLGTALLAGGVAASALRRVAPLPHAGGATAGNQLAAMAGVGAVGGALVYPSVNVASLAGGLLDSVLRTGHPVWGSPVPVHALSVAREQPRLLATYLLAGCVGAVVAAVVRSRVATTVVAAALVAAYLPVTAAVANRARSMLDALPFLPFGALRGALLGNGGVVDVDPSHARHIAPFAAAAVLLGWLLAGVAAAVLVWAKVLRPGERHSARHGAVAAGLAGAVVAGAVLPGVLRDEVPWRWQPAWRDASAAGWASNQVALRWAQHGTSPAEVRALFASDRAAAAVQPEAVAPLRLPASVEVEPVARMLQPTTVRLLLHFRRPVRSGNVAVRSAGYQLSFRQVGGRYLITNVLGPVPVDAALLASPRQP